MTSSKAPKGVPGLRIYPYLAAVLAEYGKPATAAVLFDLAAPRVLAAAPGYDLADRIRLFFREASNRSRGKPSFAPYAARGRAGGIVFGPRLPSGEATLVYSPTATVVESPPLEGEAPKAATVVEATPRAPDSVEEAVLGSAESQRKTVESDGRGPRITRDTVLRQTDAAANSGQLGEEAFEYWLRKSEHAEQDFVWVSQEHARASFDFEVLKPKWETTFGPVYLDVKSTTGEASNPFHLTMAEVRWAASHSTYRIGRVSRLTERSADVSILSGVHEVCKDLVEKLGKALPSDVAIDSIELVPTRLDVVFQGVIEWGLE